MPTDGQINITDPQGILLIAGVVLAYLLVRLFPRFLVGFSNYLSAAEMNQRLDSGEDLLLVDVRERREFVGELGHVRGSINIPLAELAVRLTQDSSLVGHRGKTVVAICRSDTRAAFAVRAFRRAGFKQVRVLSGGMLAWLADDLPVVHSRRVP